LAGVALSRSPANNHVIYLPLAALGGAALLPFRRRKA
jgi:hypothetical protein